MDIVFVRTENGTSTSGFLSNYEATFDITNDLDYITNKFELKTILPTDSDGLLWAENQISSIIYVDGTEYGGEILGSVINIADNTITYTGRTWRGQLDQFIIEPPSGYDYLTVSGNLADSLALLPMPTNFTIEATAYTGNSYSFERYVPTFRGASKLLTACQSDLRLGVQFDSNAYSGTVTLSVEQTRDLTSLVEVSQDYNDKIQLVITRNSDTPRELICLGSGELKDRQVVKLYADSDWNVSTTPISGAYPVEVYDYSSSSDLEADGRAHFLELIHNHEQIEVNINDLDIQLADIISAKDVLSGETVTAEITSIIWRVSNFGDYQTEDFEYKTKVLL